MIVIYVVILAAIFGAIGQFIDKYIANIGTSKSDYFYYMSLTMIPFSLIMVIVEYFTGQLRFEFSLISLALLICAMILRYYKQHTIIGCLKYLNPYEYSAYLTLGIVIAFVIDVILGVEKFEIIAVLSIFITLMGVFVISNAKLKIKNLQKDLLIRILTSLAMSYITYFMLKHWSNAIFLLVLNLLLVIIFAKDYSIKYHKEKKQTLKWCFVQQIFGFTCLYFSNYLASNSVTLSSYVRPTSILVVLIISMFLKNIEKKPSLKQTLGVIFIVIGLALLNC